MTPGEKVYIIGNPYAEATTKILESTVVRKLGFDILIEQSGDAPLSGFSGSPIVDANGALIGVFSSASSDPKIGKNVVVGISTEYLQKVLSNAKSLNLPKRDYGKEILDVTIMKGVAKAIDHYKDLTRNPSNYYRYNLRSANRNGLLETGQKLIELNRLNDAIKILEFNVQENGLYFHNYNVLAKAYLAAGQKEKAIESFRKSTSLLNDNQENEAFAELSKLENK